MARGLVSQQNLINTANAIRFSTEDSTKMLPSEMPDNIKNIEGKIVTLPKGRVNFYDYDGELLYSYSPKEFIEKGLPNNPKHEDLVAQGWNWNYEEITSQIKEVGGDINVGQMYITQSGATQIDIELDQDGLEPYLYFQATPSDNNIIKLIVDWGDNSIGDNGSFAIYSNDGQSTIINQKHIYSQPGKYTIKIKVIQGQIKLISNLNTNAEILWDNLNNNDHFYKNKIINIRFGNNTIIGDHAFYYCRFLKTITLSNTITSLGSSYDIFYSCYTLKSLTVPNSVISMDNDIGIADCYALQTIILPKTITSINNRFVNCFSLKTFTIPNSIISIGDQYIQNSIFSECYSLEKLIIPDSVTLIGTQSFAIDVYIKEYHFRSKIPCSLGNHVFSLDNIIYKPLNCKIYVPYSEDHSVLNAYKTATNWSTWANYIVEEDAPVDYTMPTPLADRPELLVDVEEAEDGDEVNYSIIMNIIDQEDE